MKMLTLKEIEQAIQGQIVAGGDIPILGVSTDTRTIKSGELFVPIRGINFDGHDFLGDARDKGAAAALVERGYQKSGLEPMSIVEVNNTLTALHDLARWYAAGLSTDVVGVTGSTGKTTTKDMVASVLGEKYQVAKNQGNLNNEIGLPLTVLGFEDNVEIVVLEMAMRREGQIRHLTRIIPPDVGVITNIGPTHLEILGTMENIARAKTELIADMGKDNVAVLNGDDSWVKSIMQLTNAEIITFGTGADNDALISSMKNLGEEGIRFSLTFRGRKAELYVPVPGHHNIYNAAAAAVVGFVFGLNPAEIRDGLACFKPSPLRMDIQETPDGVKIINDTYNANPVSMKAALEVLAGLRKEGQTFAALGDMLELGSAEKTAHVELGKLAHTLGIDFLFAVGPLGKLIIEGAKQAGMDDTSARWFSAKEELVEQLRKLLESGDVVLVKGSRGMHMETVVDMLLDIRQGQKENCQ